MTAYQIEQKLKNMIESDQIFSEETGRELNMVMAEIQMVPDIGIDDIGRIASMAGQIYRMWQTWARMEVLRV